MTVLNYMKSAGGSIIGMGAMIFSSCHRSNVLFLLGFDFGAEIERLVCLASQASLWRHPRGCESKPDLWKNEQPCQVFSL